MGFSSTVDTTHINAQYDALIQIIKDTFGETSDRTTKLLKLYADFEDRIKEAPASGKLNFHCAYEGGYLDHIHNVLRCAKNMASMYKKMGGTIDFTMEELVFCALHHDLGKLGTLEEPYYVPQDSEWHRNNRLEIFKHNEDRQYITSSDCTMFNLQKYGIELTQNEFLAIKMTDGLYDKSNEKYLIQYGAGPFPLRCSLFRIMHWADHMAACIEYDDVRAKMVR
jgi:hypothetical protein